MSELDQTNPKLEDNDENSSDLKSEQNLGSVPPDLDDDDDAPSSGKRERRKIEIRFIQDKSRRHITFSKRKAGIMKKAYELSVLTGTQVLLLVVSETGLVYTFTTPKLQPLVTKPEGKNLIQACLNAPEDGLDENDEEQSQSPQQPPQQQPQQQPPQHQPQQHQQHPPPPPNHGQGPIPQGQPPHLQNHQSPNQQHQQPQGHYPPPPPPQGLPVNQNLGGPYSMPGQGYGSYPFDQMNQNPY